MVPSELEVKALRRWKLHLQLLQLSCKTINWKVNPINLIGKSVEGVGRGGGGGGGLTEGGQTLKIKNRPSHQEIVWVKRTLRRLVRLKDSCSATYCPLGFTCLSLLEEDKLEG